ncbi:ROK family protein [Spiroplasma melliferum]|uniref:Glucokinase n=2 Tax=Spiroplasma melliferum TaxID=2134 RepID=A0AAI9T3K1_SPIME|nr:ROK family protein [Spiroplasma melliferum]ELL44518.1 glucokinase [Spiroplasma melliferum IPMB4A]KAI92445.1 glucokinase [Spiroplasma melliferum KC3]QCO23349.1 glucokinase [Spiroplasma melliferum]
MNVLAIDLGGTSSKCAVFSEKKVIRCEFKVTTNKAAILQTIKEEIDQQLEKHQIDWSTISQIGFAIPGFLDEKNGIVALAGNLNWRNFNIKGEAEKIFQKPVHIINDANAAALAEYWDRIYDKKESLVLYTLGTGIGGGIVLNGQLWTGANGFAGELGHGGCFQTLFACTCGLENCIEPVSSATGLTKLINQTADENPGSLLNQLKEKEKHDLKLVDIKPLFDKNDELTIATITRGLIPLAYHIVTMLYILNPQIIILAGGVTNLGVKLKNILQELVKARIGDFMLKTFTIEISNLQDKAGMYGTGYYALSKMDETK